MGINFTDDQQEVIKRRDCNILVSAAAGSGKTAVLVERIITRLTKDTPPLNVDQLLIVTFTEAAAAEMKERIHGAIEELLQKEPFNEHLQRQATLIHNAQITTIHSFCLSVIREYFHTIDLEPGFRVADEGEVKLLKYDVANELLEQYYEDGRKEFLDFVECYTAGKKDDELENMILRLYEYASGYPDAKEWLDSCVAKYTDVSACFESAVTFSKRYLADDKAKIEYMIRQCEEPDGPSGYLGALHADCQMIERMLQASDYEEMNREFAKKEWQRLGSNKGKEVSKEAAERVKGMRDEVKKQVDDLANRFFYRSPEELAQDMQKAAPNMAILVELVEKFGEAFRAKKQSRNLIDFNDMEHYALEILQQDAVAEEYRNRFAEIMIDEYQDSNLIQEALLTAVSRISRGEYNIFMVGDVKQSIYSFRLSRPELFMEKYATYDKEKGDKQRIDLHQNFRSRKEVLDSTNYIFRQIMCADLGKIQYDYNAELHLGASYEEQEGNQAEMLLLQKEELTDGNVREWEARLVARRIKELVGVHQVKDKKSGIMRAAEYGDIVVLTRSLKGWTDVFSRVLMREGIPTHTDSRSGYYETLEIKLLLDYLRVLDNPYQDIPLVAVLTAVFGNVTNEELAKLKADSEGTYFYERVRAYAQEGEDTILVNKLKRFLEMLEQFRSRICYLPMQELLRDVLRETGYEDFVSAMPGGEQRSANLAMLMEKAVSFEKTSYKGLFHFVRYIEQLQKYDIDCGEANTEDEQTGAVRLMSIHKSKGLEFPIVIVAGMGKRFNMMDANSSVAIHSGWGVGIEAIDYERRTKLPTLIRKIVQRELALDTVAEELRILYVAMTRAKEKLILTGVVEGLDKKMSSYGMLRYLDEQTLFYSQLADARDYLDWILPALYRNRAFDQVLNAFGEPACFTNALYGVDACLEAHLVTPEELAGLDVVEELQSGANVGALQHLDLETVYDRKTYEELQEQMNYAYQFQVASAMNQKMSVSELKKRAYMEEEGGTFLYEAEEVVPLLPKFLQEQEELTGASRGTAYHRFLELLDYTKEHNKESICDAKEQMFSAGYLTEDMVKVIKEQDVLTFLQSSIGARMQAAAREGKLLLEQPFMLGVSPKEIYPDMSEDEIILVQGIIDAYFEEGEELVVVDYKTDFVRSGEELLARYRVQLEHYANALSRLTGKSVKERWIYSFALRRGIEV